MHTISILKNYIYAYLCIQSFLKQFTDDYLSNHLYGQEARKVFVQHPRYNIEVFLKRANDGRAIIHRRWAKVAKAFNILEGSIFAFRFDSFPDEIHQSIYRLWWCTLQNLLYHRFGVSVLRHAVLAAGCTVISVIIKILVTITSIWKILCYIYMNVLISAIKKYPKIFQINTMLIKLLVIRSLHTVLHIISSPIAMYITHIR